MHRYSPDVAFRDPLASYTGLDTYKQALKLLKDSKLSSGVRFETHDVSIAGKGLVRARWTLSAECPLLPWTPRVVFTGVSIYTLNSAGRVIKHEDEWDSCSTAELPLLGGLRDILFGGAGLWCPQADESFYMPPSKTLFRGKNYQLRRLEDYRCVEMDYVSMPRSTKQVAVRALNEYWGGANVEGAVLPPSQPTMILVDEPTLQSPKTVSCFLPRGLAQVCRITCWKDSTSSRACARAHTRVCTSTIAHERLRMCASRSFVYAYMHMRCM